MQIYNEEQKKAKVFMLLKIDKCIHECKLNFNCLIKKTAEHMKHPEWIQNKNHWIWKIAVDSLEMLGIKHVA